MRKLLIAVLLLGGCRRSAPPLPPPPPPPVPQAAVYQVAAEQSGMAVKVYRDTLGREFCYDDSDAVAPPEVFPERFDRALAVLKEARPGIDSTEAPRALESIVVKLMPSENAGQYPGIEYPFFLLGSIPGMPPDPLRVYTGLTRPEVWPMMVYVVAEPWQQYPAAAALAHEYLHVLARHYFPLERCPEQFGFVFEHIGHNTACDPLTRKAAQ